MRSATDRTILRAIAAVLSLALAYISLTAVTTYTYVDQFRPLVVNINSDLAFGGLWSANSTASLRLTTWAAVDNSNPYEVVVEDDSAGIVRLVVGGEEIGDVHVSRTSLAAESNGTKVPISMRIELPTKDLRGELGIYFTLSEMLSLYESRHFGLAQVLTLETTTACNTTLSYFASGDQATHEVLVYSGPVECARHDTQLRLEPSRASQRLWLAEVVASIAIFVLATISSATLLCRLFFGRKAAPEKEPRAPEQPDVGAGVAVYVTV
uniref:Uncharacterized protein n=1 Tax=Strombidinopsis acuminata TaxID=141414 RepID=A0A7S3RCA9_9SPIT